MVKTVNFILCVLYHGLKKLGKNDGANGAQVRFERNVLAITDTY